jgi:endonuclease III
MGTPRTPKTRTREVARRLEQMYPEALCELNHTNPFELLTATILSAQTTDARVNMVTPALFASYPNAAALADANPADVEEIIRSTGFYQAKTKNLIGMARAVVERFSGQVPSVMEDLVSLDGVGRKTANVVRSVAFGLPGLPVDTHVGRLTQKLALTNHQDPVKIEKDLGSNLPEAQWGPFSLRIILHGRRVCDAKKPLCSACGLEDICPSSLLPSRAKRTAQQSGPK